MADEPRETQPDGTVPEGGATGRTRPLSRLLPPRPQLVTATILVVVLVAGSGLGWALGGGLTAVGVAHGVLTTLVLATRKVEQGTRLAASVVLAAAPALGLLARGNAVLLVVLVAAVALRIAAAVAVLGGGGAALLAPSAEHVFWYVLVIVQVLRPVEEGVLYSARGRVLGTLGGLVVAMLLVPWLPGPVLLVLAIVLTALGSAWALAARPLPQMHCTTPALLLLTVVAGQASVDVVALERVVLISVGARLALASVLAWQRVRTWRAA